jgi:hypothetical protein
MSSLLYNKRDKKHHRDNSNKGLGNRFTPPPHLESGDRHRQKVLFDRLAGNLFIALGCFGLYTNELPETGK